MSVLSDMMSSMVMPAMLDISGVTATRITHDGTETPGIAVLWHEYAEDRLASLRPKRDTAEGLEIERHGLMQLLPSQTYDERDCWMILDEKWCVQRVGPIVSGYRELYMQLNDKRSTRKAARVRNL